MPVRPFIIGTLQVEPGEKAVGGLSFMQTPTGDSLQIPLLVVHGVEPGPTLYLNSGTHGDEPEGTIAILDAVAELDPRVLRGTVVGVPVLNVPAFVGKASVDVAGVRETPLDWKNLARIFPGRADGTATERLAHVVSTEILPRVNYALDFHSGGTRGTSHLIAGFVGASGPMGRRSLELAKLFPVETLWRVSPWSKFASVCLERGIAVAVIETTGQGRAEQGDVDVLLVGIRNVMRSLEMISGPIERIPTRRRCIDTEVYLYASVGGILRPDVRTGELIREGQRLGRVIDAHGTITQEVVCPLTGIVTGIRTKPVVWAGDPMFLVAEFLPDDEAVWFERAEGTVPSPP